MADAALISTLESSVSKISDGWKSVTSKKMFGCPAFWVNNNVFALVWKHGRIGVKLTDEKSYDGLLNMKGSEPWKAGPMKMSHWVLVPDSFHSDSKSLKKWLQLAYEQNETAVVKPKKKDGNEISKEKREIAMYSHKTLNGHYFKTSGFYFFFIPIAVPYKKVYSMAESAGLKLKENFGPILESGKMFGFGWIGIEVERPTENRTDVVQVKGDYESYEYKGAYKTLGRAYKKLMKEKPGKKEYLNLFLDDPEKIKPDDCRTVILFR